MRRRPGGQHSPEPFFFFKIVIKAIVVYLNRMVFGIFNESLNNLLGILPPYFSENVEWFLAILKALGILAVVYLSYLITMVCLNVRKVRQLGKIRARMENIDSKLDLLIKKEKIRVPKSLITVSSTKVGFWEKIMKRFSE